MLVGGLWDLLDAIIETHRPEDLGQQGVTVEFAPMVLRVLGQLEDHREGGGPRAASFGPHGAHLVDPAPLDRDLLAVLFLQGTPEAQGSVAHRQLRRDRQPPALQIPQHFKPTLLAFAVTVSHRHQLLGSLFQDPDDDQDADVVAESPLAEGPTSASNASAICPVETPWR